MMDSLTIADKIQISVTLGESHFREFKSALQGAPGKKSPRSTKEICKDVAEALVAFANADGGEILIGVEDSGEITGCTELGIEAIDAVLKSPLTHVLAETPLQSVKKTHVLLGTKSVIYFSVPKSSTHVHQTSDGRCLRRNDLETIPISSSQVQFDRAEQRSREYDREFLDGANVADLDADLLQIVSDHISKGMSAEKCLQYLGLAEYGGPDLGTRLRRAALLLFARKINRWHPRCQVRILKIKGAELGTGSAYNVLSDIIVSENVCRIVDASWDQLRPYLVQTTLNDDARFQTTFVYPESACREALVNAIAHRDYADEGSGVEVYIFDDRMEIRSPGGLLSTISVDDLKSMKGTHQSRNSNVARTLRELGYMRELGEGMRRIFELMKSNELAPPEILNNGSSFSLTLHHRAMYSKVEEMWLEQFSVHKLTAEHKAILLLGRSGDLISTQNIIDRVGIVDVEHYRQLSEYLQRRGLLRSEMNNRDALRVSKSKKLGREIFLGIEYVFRSRYLEQKSLSRKQEYQLQLIPRAPSMFLLEIFQLKRLRLIYSTSSHSLGKLRRSLIPVFLLTGKGMHLWHSRA
jgi:ATP-dependent DNA helicase RecG